MTFLFERVVFNYSNKIMKHFHCKIQTTKRSSGGERNSHIIYSNSIVNLLNRRLVFSFGRAE